MKIFVFGYANWDYEFDEFIDEEFDDVESAQAFILDKINNQKDSDGNPIWNDDSFTVVFGTKLGFDAEKGVLSIKIKGLDEKEKASK